MNDLRLLIIKAQRIPCRMLATRTCVEILIGRTVEIAQTLLLVLHGMRVNQIHNHSDAATVRIVNQRLQLLRSTKTGRCGKETAHMITKRAVVWVLLNSHNLDAIVAQRIHARQHVLAELLIRGHTLGIAAHSYMALIDEQTRLVALGLNRHFMRKTIRLRRPYLGRENLRTVVLHHARRI